MTGIQHTEMGKGEGGWFACYLGNSRAAIAAHSLNPFGVKHRLLLVKVLIHIAHVALLCLKHAGQVHLGAQTHTHTHTHTHTPMITSKCV